MSKDQIKYEISKVLDSFPDVALEELLSFLKGLETKHNRSELNMQNLQRILSEDHELLEKLAK